MSRIRPPEGERPSTRTKLRMANEHTARSAFSLMVGLLARFQSAARPLTNGFGVTHPRGMSKRLLPHSHFALSELFCYKAIPIKLENLRDSFCVEGYSLRQASFHCTKGYCMESDSGKTPERIWCA